MEELVFAKYIVKNTYIPPRNQVCTSLRFFWLLEGNGERKKMELLISLTSPCCCCSARSGQHSSYDECLISRNTSQIAKLYLPWIAKCVLSCSVVQKNNCGQWGSFVPNSQFFRPATEAKQCCPLIFCQFIANLFLFHTHEKVRIFLESAAQMKMRGSCECVLAIKCV